MTYRDEVVIPIEVGFLTFKTNQFNVEENNYLLSTSLELIEERKRWLWLKWCIISENLSKGMSRE